jgi:hypothetical protein
MSGDLDALESQSIFILREAFKWIHRLAPPRSYRRHRVTRLAGGNPTPDRLRDR